jgi:enoyl-CoA hydratase/carnithine racemase
MKEHLHTLGDGTRRVPCVTQFRPSRIAAENWSVAPALSIFSADANPMPSELLTERHGAVLVLTLSEPASRNSLSHQAIAAGIEALNVAESDPHLRVVVLLGDGAHFCAGGNLQGLMERRRAGPPAQVQMIEHLHQFIEALHVFPKPVIAAVEGAAAGAGFSLALACDMMVAAEDARFILSHARLGLSPDGGATWALTQSLPRALVQQWVWLAEPVSAQQLHQHGLVATISDSGQAFAEALRLAHRLADMAPNALASGKELVRQASSRTLAQQLAAERDHFVENLFHENGAEGLQAFVDKRAANFR